MIRRFATIAAVLLLASSLPLGSVAAGAAGGTRSAVAEPSPTGADLASPVDDRSDTGTASANVAADRNLASDGDTIHRTITLRHRPDRPGVFEVEVAFDLPERVTGFRATPGRVAGVEATDGFDYDGDRTFEWTESTRAPSIRYLVSANESGSERRTSPSIDRGVQGGGYVFAGTAEWGVVRVPDLSLQWSRTGDAIATDRTVRVDGPGATGGDIAYFGEVTEYARTADSGERFRLVVPDAADLRESPEDVLDSLADASAGLDVGDRRDEVFVLVAPTETVEWAVRGIQYGDGDAWVAADARLDVASNVWLHEYVHTRQAFARTNEDTTTETRWLIEATAEYYAALLSLEQGRIDYDRFESFLARGGDVPYAGATLSEPSTWRDARTAYVKGPLVAGAIDRRIRLDSGGEAALSTVLRDMNRRDGRTTLAVFLESVEKYGDGDARAVAERYATTGEAPATWSREEHRAAFDQAAPAFEYALADGESVAVSGPYRETSGTEIPTLVVGETVTASVVVENVGDRGGPYDAVFRVDGRTVDGAEGRLEAGASGVETLEWEPTAPGRYEVVVGDRRTTVRVREPARLTTADATVDPGTVEPGEDVTVTATIENDADVPGERAIRIRTPSGVAHEESVRLGAGESTTVETTVRFDDPGEYEVGVDDVIRTVRVERETGESDPVDDVDDALPGFGAGPAVAALLVAAVLARRR